MYDIYCVQITRSKMFCCLVTTLLTIGHLMLSPLAAAPSIASLVNEQGSITGCIPVICAFDSCQLSIFLVLLS